MTIETATADDKHRNTVMERDRAKRLVDMTWKDANEIVAKIMATAKEIEYLKELLAGYQSGLTRATLAHSKAKAEHARLDAMVSAEHAELLRATRQEASE